MTCSPSNCTSSRCIYNDLHITYSIRRPFRSAQSDDDAHWTRCTLPWPLHRILVDTVSRSQSRNDLQSHRNIVSASRCHPSRISSIWPRFDRRESRKPHPLLTWRWYILAVTAEDLLWKRPRERMRRRRRRCSSRMRCIRDADGAWSECARLCRVRVSSVFVFRFYLQYTAM